MISPSLRALVGASIGIAGILSLVILGMALRPALRVVRLPRHRGRGRFHRQSAFGESAEVKRPFFLSRAAKN